MNAEVPGAADQAPPPTRHTGLPPAHRGEGCAAVAETPALAADDSVTPTSL